MSLSVHTQVLEAHTSLRYGSNDKKVKNLVVFSKRNPDVPVLHKKAAHFRKKCVQQTKEFVCKHSPGVCWPPGISLK